jgi:hypothetical protein
MTVGTVLGVEPALNTSRRVLRQSLKIADEQVIELPWVHRIIHVAMSRQFPSDRIDVWYEVGTLEGAGSDFDVVGRPCKYKVFVEGTGHKVEPGTQYVGTTIDDKLRLVWHVYIGHAR